MFGKTLRVYLMSQFDPQAVQSYIDEGDRQSPLFFTGRQQEQGMAQGILRNLRAGKTQGNILVFQGAPGAGKTALLNHLKETLQNECVTARLSVSIVHQPDIALFEVLKQLEPKRAKKLKKTYQKRVHGGINVGVGSAGTEVSSSDVPQDITTIQHLMSLRKNRDKPLLLFLDEAQNANGDMPDGKSSILQQLHEGNTGNVSLIAGGLSDTQAKLNQLGISRLSSGNVTTLQPLQDQEVLAAFEAFLDNETFGIDRHGDITRLQQLVVDESMGWPQHLTNTLHAISEELITVNGRLAECDISAIQQRSQARREEYYSHRVETIPTALLFEVVSTIPKGHGISELEVHKTIERAYAHEPILEKMLPSEDAYDVLIHRGVLQADATGNLTVPIPSMHDYIKERTRSFGQTVSVRPWALIEEKGGSYAR